MSLMGSTTQSTNNNNNSSEQIKNFISICYDYFLRKSDRILAQLQRQIQLLSVVEELSIFEPTSVEALEFFSCLEQLVQADERLAWKAITLILHMIKAQSVLLALRDEIKMASVVAEFLLTSKLSSEKQSKTIYLLNRLTHGIKIERVESWLLQLLPHLVHTITNSPPPSSTSSSADPDSSSVLFMSLSTLANLCRSSQLVVHCLKTWTSIEKLINFLSTQSGARPLQLMCLEVYLHIQRIGIQRIGPVNLTLPLLFSVCQDGVTDGRADLIQQATDTLRSIGGITEWRPILTSYSNYEKDCNSLLEAIDNSPKCPAPEAAGFIATLLRLQLPALNSFLPQFINKSLEWVSCVHSISPPCLQLIHSLLSVASREVVDKHAKDFLSMAKSLLTPPSQFTLHSLSLVVDALRVLQALVSHDINSNNLVLLCSLSPSLLTDLLPFFSDFNSHLILMSERGSFIARKYSEASGYELDCTVASTYEGNRTRQPSPCSSEVLSSAAGAQLCSEAVLRLLCVMNRLGNKDKSFNNSFNKLMSSGSLMPHVTRCLTSTNRELVELAATLLIESREVTNECLDSFINSTYEANTRKAHHHHPLDTAVTTALTDSLCDLNSSTSTVLPTNNNTSRLNADVEDVMAKLKGCTNMAEMRDTPLAEIVDLYEFKLASMEHSSQAMTELLSNADAKCRLLERNVLQANAESTKVRLMLRSCHQRMQAVEGEKLAALERNEALRQEYKVARETIMKEKAACEREASRLRGTVNTLHTELNVKEELLSKAAQEAKTLQRLIEQEKNGNKDLQKKLQSSEEAQQASMKSIANLEKSLQQVKQENGDLEKLLHDMENNLAEKDKQLEEMAKTNESLKRIQDMIHNISAGKAVV